MSLKNTRGRHRAVTISPMARMYGSALDQTRAGSRQAAVAVVGAGLLLGSAVPAQAGAIASAPATDFTPIQSSSATAPTEETYTVQAGDTLGLIATRHGIDLPALLSLNGLSMDTVIYPGDRINVTPGAVTSGAQPEMMTLTQLSGPAVTSSVYAAGSVSAEVAPSSANQAILAAARAQLGAVQDCTVLGEVALRAAGIQGVGDESPESLMAYATPVSDPQPGDFIYYADGGMGFSHNAVYIGNGQAIHSGWNGNQTVVESVDVGSGPIYYRVNA